MSALAVTRSVALVCTGLAAGVLLGHRMGVSIARPDLDPGSFIRLQQTIHVTFSRLMPVLMIVGLVASLAWTSLIWRQRRAERWLIVAAVLGMGTVLTLTLAVNVPINALLMTWDAAAPPQNLEALWSPWERSHSIRTVVAIGAFALQAFAVGAREGRDRLSADLR